MTVRNNQQGFTIIELLVVIVVIAILVALTLPNLFSAQTRARDTQRKNDLKNVKTQLETYYNDNNSYPTDANWDTALESGYIDAVPEDPQGGAYTYVATDAAGVSPCAAEPCSSYTLTATLENENDVDTADGSADYVINSVNQ